MRAIFQTVSAAALGLSSLSLAGTVQADAFSITYSDSNYGHPAYLIHYRYGPDYHGHVHHRHYDRHHKHGKHYKHDRHHKRHADYGPPGHRSHWRDGDGAHAKYYGHTGKRDHHRGHTGKRRGDHDGDRFRGRGKSRSHDTHARR